MAITTYVGSPGTVASASGGKMHVLNGLTTTPTPANIGLNPQRVSLMFHNPGTIGVYVYPLTDFLGQPIIPSLPNNLGGCLQILPSGTFVVTGECQTGWGAFAASGTTACLSVMSTNI
jgi:hypothetical protein